MKDIVTQVRFGTAALKPVEVANLEPGITAKVKSEVCSGAYLFEAGHGPGSFFIQVETNGPEAGGIQGRVAKLPRPVKQVANLGQDAREVG